MKNKIIIYMLLILSTQIYVKEIITLSQDAPYAFTISSHLKKRPVQVHSQHNNHLRVSCRPTDFFDNTYQHSCKIRAKTDAPKGTFALFLKTAKNDLKTLFHVSVE